MYVKGRAFGIHVAIVGTIEGPKSFMSGFVICMHRFQSYLQKRKHVQRVPSFHTVLYAAGLATEVVSVPLSMYVPEKNQSSAPVPSLPWRGRRRTPRCQSAPLLDVLVEKGPAVLTSEEFPVECQNVTWFDPKLIS